jgi:hypothetical protein
LLAALAIVIAAGTGVAVWLVAGGSGSSGSAAPPKDDPVVFLRGIVQGIAANDYELVWPKLHPAQQRVATRQVYVRCEQLSPIPGHLDWIRVVGTADERITVAGDEGVVDSKAVTFRLRLSEPSLDSAVVVTRTVHAVAVEGHWRWILTPKRFASYRSGSCPSAGEPPPSASA